MWDFRRYDDGEHWTIPKLNDVGNWASFPAIALAASWVIDDPALKSRLRELAVSHADFVFGRNPRLAAAPHKPEMGFPEIERGWPVGHKLNVCARLELCRGCDLLRPRQRDVSLQSGRPLPPCRGLGELRRQLVRQPRLPAVRRRQDHAVNHVARCDSATRINRLPAPLELRGAWLVLPWSDTMLAITAAGLAEPAITTIQQIRDLPREQARSRHCR